MSTVTKTRKTRSKGKKAMTLRSFMNWKPLMLGFTGKWQRLLGNPELTGSWLVWGPSANGKSYFCLELANYLSQFAKVAYLPLEEGASASFQRRIIEVGIDVTNRNFVPWFDCNADEMISRLTMRNAPRIIIIDSWQYAGMNYSDYKKLRQMFPDRLFIIISHADGKEPSGAVAQRIRYDAFCKIFVSGFVANAQSRYGGELPLVIWREGAERAYSPIEVEQWLQEE